MKKLILLSCLLVGSVLTGCQRDYAWDPNRMDEGALERPFQTLAGGTMWRVLRDPGVGRQGPKKGTGCTTKVGCWMKW